MFRVKNILYATDFSSYSTQAYFHAVSLAENMNARLVILHALAPGREHQHAGDASYWRQQLERVRPSNPKIEVEHVLLEGDPAQEIVSYAARNRMDVIVLGTHGRSGVDRLLMGSVAERVLREAPCSVLVVKLPKGARPAESTGSPGS